jgi:hydrogenase maturation protease
MSLGRESATVVVGVGSLIHSDDAAGLKALRLLEKDPRLPPGVELIDGSILGLDVIALIQNAACLLFLDAVDAGAEPGTVVRLEGETLRGLPSGTSAHDIGISGLLSLLEFLGTAPERVALVGIQPATTEMGVWLSPEVQAGLDRLVAESVRLLTDWFRSGSLEETPIP